MQVSAVFSVSKLNSSATEIFLLIVRLFMDFKHLLKVLEDEPLRPFFFRHSENLGKETRND